MMKYSTALLLVFMVCLQSAMARTACESPVITSSADVSVSDGMQYGIETYYRNTEETVVTFTGPNASQIVSEGPWSWYSQGDDAALAGDPEKGFAIGHQYHAMLLHFDDVMSDVRNEEIQFRGETRNARTGDFPTGGIVSLVDGDQSNQPIGFLMLLPGETPIEVLLDDWRDDGIGRSLPFGLAIHHGDRVFTYDYTSVTVGQGDALGFQASYPSPGIDEIAAYRSQQKIRASECSGGPSESS